MADKVHAPRAVLKGESKGAEMSITMCNSSAASPLIASRGETVTCQACISALHDWPQWGNLLIKRGYRFLANRRPKKGRKADPRQMSMGFE